MQVMMSVARCCCVCLVDLATTLEVVTLPNVTWDLTIPHWAGEAVNFASCFSPYTYRVPTFTQYPPKIDAAGDPVVFEDRNVAWLFDDGAVANPETGFDRVQLDAGDCFHDYETLPSGSIVRSGHSYAYTLAPTPPYLPPWQGQSANVPVYEGLCVPGGFSGTITLWSMHEAWNQAGYRQWANLQWSEFNLPVRSGYDSWSEYAIDLGDITVPLVNNVDDLGGTGFQRITNATDWVVRFV